MANIYEIHRLTRENLAGKTTTGVLPKFNYSDTVAVEEGPAILDRYTIVSGLILDHPTYSKLDSGNHLDANYDVSVERVLPNSRGEFIERFRDEWFKPDGLPNGVTWDTVNYKLRWE